MNDTPTLARFEYGWAPDGIGKDGFPIFKNVLRIIRERPPYLALNDPATDAEIEEYPQPYALFQKEQAARKPVNEEGYPLAYWPVPTPAEFQMLAARDVHTVQKLATLVTKKAELPPSLFELAQRAKAMVDMHKDIGKYEGIINGLTGERDALAEQLRENRLTIENMQAQIDLLRARTAA